VQPVFRNHYEVGVDKRVFCEKVGQRLAEKRKQHNYPLEKVATDIGILTGIETGTQDADLFFSLTSANIIKSDRLTCWIICEPLASPLIKRLSFYFTLHEVKKTERKKKKKRTLYSISVFKISD
jgi:hypothetical protein